MPFAIRRHPEAFTLDPSSKQTKRITDDKHLAFIRTLPSVISGAYGCDACHIRYGDPVYRKKHTGGQQKPDDAWTVPMTRDEHREQHDGDERVFWQRQGIDPLRVARDLYAVSGNTEAAITIILSARTK